jgi:hypothetical protein
MKRRNPLVILFAVVVLIGAVYFAADYAARLSLARRLDIEPSWSSFSGYFETHFEVGMKRKDVVDAAIMTNGYYVIPQYLGDERYCDLFIFTVGPFGAERGGRWAVCYDENDIVISVDHLLYH